jgi:tRNA (cytidine/uridine-2'-O-)-methyltransferase
MDYTDIAEIVRHNTWDAFKDVNKTSRIVLLSTKADQNLWRFEFAPTDILLLGRESSGVPDFVHDACDSSVVLPMPGGGRSMNVTMCAGIAISEALRQVGYWTSPEA